jgi:hypothetical protein
VNAPSEPIPELPVSRDGIYPRCVWCGGENYMLAVLAYSRGDTPCAAVYSCGLYLPESYRRATPA